MIEAITTEELMDELLLRHPHSIMVINVSNENGQTTITRFNGQYHVGLGLLEMGKIVIKTMIDNTPPPRNPFL